MIKIVKSLDDFMKGIKDNKPVTTKLESFNIDTSKNLFGEFARYPESVILQLQFENGAVINTSAKGLQLKDKKLVVADENAFYRSVTNERSNLGKFIRKYGIPKLDQEVESEIDNRGFFRIVL